MSRRGLIVIAVVVVLLLASPFVIGMINESSVRNGIEEFDQNATIAADVASYERGFMSSKARLEFGIDPDYLRSVVGPTTDPMLDMITEMKVPVIAEFEHGPILRSPGIGLGTASIHAYIDPEWEYAQMVQGLLGIPYIIDFRGRGSLGLGFEFEGDIPPFEFAMPDASLDFSGIDFTGSFGGGHKTFDGTLDHVALQSMFFSAIVDAVSVGSDTQQADRDALPLGTSELRIGRVAFNDPFAGVASSFSADGISVASTTSANADSEFIDMAMVYAFDSLKAGADIAVDDSQLGIRLEHLDAAAISQFLNFMQSAELAANPDALTQELMPLLGDLLAGGPVMYLDPLTFSMPQGTATGKVTVMLPQDAVPAGMPLNDLALINAMSSVQVTFDAEASKPLVQYLVTRYMQQQMAAFSLSGFGQPEPSPEQLAAEAALQAGGILLALSAQGYIIDNGDTWTTQITLENGVPMANGQLLQLGF